MLFGLNPDQWAAIGSNAQALTTVIVILIGVWQIQSYKTENLKSRTLDKCDRYSTDPILDASLAKLYEFKIGTVPAVDPKILKGQVASVLNYLDGLAKGVEQGLYIDSLAKDHLKAVVKEHVDDYLRSEESARRFGIDIKDYHRLIEMATRWEHEPLAFRSYWMRRRK